MSYFMVKLFTPAKREKVFIPKNSITLTPQTGAGLGIFFFAKRYRFFNLEPFILYPLSFILALYFPSICLIVHSRASSNISTGGSVMKPLSCNDFTMEREYSISFLAILYTSSQVIARRATPSFTA